jgi:hypothetical protein
MCYNKAMRLPKDSTNANSFYTPRTASHIRRATVEAYLLAAG